MTISQIPSSIKEVMFSIGSNPAYYYWKTGNGESFWSLSWSEVGLKVPFLVNHFKTKQTKKRYGKYE